MMKPPMQKSPVQNSFKPTFYHPVMKINSHLKKVITFFLFSNKIIARNNHVLFPTITILYSLSDSKGNGVRFQHLCLLKHAT